jgi:hypothetical protein
MVVRGDRHRRVRILGGVVVGLYLAFGIAELATHLDEPSSLWFWVSALFGGALLVYLGVFRYTRGGLSVGLVVAGVAVASLATVWTIVIPVVARVLVTMVVRRASLQGA